MKQPLINVERKFRPEIEGLRIVAALLVAVYHIWFNRVSGGVDVFFVISGFLITTSIISTVNRTGKYHFWPYISKLIKRLFPSVFFILGVVVALSFFLLPGSITGKTVREVIASMFYYQNWQLAFSSTDYLDSSQMKSPVEHFWALSIQGQFYIIWFLIFSSILFFIKKFKLSNARKLINFVLGTLFIASLIYSIYLTRVNQPWAYFITFTRVWEFALGGLICVNLPSIKVSRTIAAIVGWFGLIGLILTGMMFNVSEMFPGYIALWPMTCAFFIILSGTHETKFGVKRLLGSPVMVKLGGISFGIYLWHWVILEFYRYNVQETPGLVVGLLIILTSILLSLLMTKFIEEPIRKSNHTNRAFRRLTAMGMVNVLLIGSLLLFTHLDQARLARNVSSKNYPGAMAVNSEINVPDMEPTPSLTKAFDDLPISHKDGSNQGFDSTDVKVGEYGKKENYDATIAVIGSSHSEQWLGAVIQAAKHHDYRVLSITRSGTRFTTDYPADIPHGEWVRNVVDYLKDSDIDLIISQGTAAHSPTKAVHQQMIDQLQYVKDAYGIQILAVRDNPRYQFNVLESLEIDGVEETTKKMNAEKNRQNDESFWKNFEKVNNSIYKLDLTDYFKENGKFKPIIGNVVIYRDENHMTNSYAESMGPMFEEKITEILGD